MPLLKPWLQSVYKKKGSLALGLILTMSTFSIIRSLRAPADTVARPSDTEKAKRTEVNSIAPHSSDTLSMKVDDPAFNGVAANAVVEPISDEILLASEVPGVIASIAVKEGQSVKKGDVLLMFRSNMESAQKNAAEADLKAARAKAELARKSRERTIRLSHDKAATQEEMDRAENTLTLESAQVLAAEARLEQAKTALERLTMKAPIDGEILKIHYNIGEYYNPIGAQSLLVMGDVQKLRIRIELDERDLAKVKIGTQGHFIADAYGSEKFAFTITDFGRRMGKKELKSDDPRERNDTRVLNIYGRVEGGDIKQLIPGLRVTAFMQSPEKDGQMSH